MKTIAPLQQEEILMQFLMGLNDSFSAIRSQILLMDHLPTVNKAYSLVLQEENERLMCTRYESQIYGTNITANEASAISFLPSAATATVTQNQQHSGPCNMPKSHRERPRCSHCNKLGHIEDRCYVKHGYPLRDCATRAPRRDAPHTANNAQSTPLETLTSIPQFTNEQYHQLLRLLSLSNSNPSANIAGKFPNSITSSLFSSPWIIDTGDSNHMTPFSSYSSNGNFKSSLHPILFPNVDLIPITKIGDICLLPDLPIFNVLRVPTFKHNLLSVSAITNSLYCAAIFYPDHCVL